MRQAGFTLLELSIVLVIVGLIIGGVTVGAELIRQAEITSVLRDFQKYQTAFQTFKLKHGQLPGDFTKAQSYWPSCTDAAGNTCNGDGDGRIGSESGPGDPREDRRVWQHLALSGVIPGAYDGTTLTVGLNMPAPAVDGGLYRTFYATLSSVSGNWLRLSSTTWYGNGALFTAAESKQIDLKIDDGMPDTGRFVTQRGQDELGNYINGCTASTQYTIDATNLACKVHLRID